MPVRFRDLAIGTMLLGGLAGPALGQEKEDGLTLDEKGATLRFLEGRASLNLGGRVYLDIGGGDVSDDDAYDIFDRNVDFAQARIELTAKWEDWLTAAYQYDLADDDAPLKDVALGIKVAPVVVSVGNFKEPFSLEELSSDNDIPFMSRSLADTFAPSRNVGGAVASGGERWTAAAGVFGGNINESVDDEGVGVTGRVTYAPIREGDDVVHVGASASYRNLDQDEVSFGTSPESFLFGASLVNTGTIEDAQNLTLVGLEAAWQGGPIRVQGEYVLANVDRDGGEGDPTFQGAYIQLAWMVNGPGRAYDTDDPDYGTEFGRFGAPKLSDAQRVSQGGYGLFELAARLSGIDLDDEDVEGGRQTDLTLGVNWYPDKNIRLMANYIRAEADDAPETEDDESADIFQVRFQLAF
jgi:phosphate-selective porin OprO/OprP